MVTGDQWRQLAEEVAADRDRHARRADVTMWAIFAGAEVHQMFGKPVRISVEWPEGLPTGFASAEEFQAFAAEQLAKLTGGES